MSTFLTKERPLFGGSVLALMALSAAVFVAYHGIMAVPVQISAMMDGLSMTEQTSGLLGTVEITMVSLVPILLAAKIDVWSKPKVALVGGVMALSGQALSMVVTDQNLLFLVRAFVGSGAGLIYGAACASSADSEDGDKLFAWGMSMAQILIATLLLFLPHIAEVYNHHQGVYATLAVATLAALCFLFFMPERRSDNSAVSGSESAARDKGTTVGLSTMTLFFASFTFFNIAIGMIWAYIEMRGSDLNMSAAEIGIVLAALPFGGVIGSIVAGIIGNRFGRVKPSVIALAVCTASCFAAALINLPLVLMASMALLGMFELFIVAFFIGTASKMDNVGRIATITGGLGFLTYGIGPALGAFLSTSLGFSVAEICMVCGGLCIVAAGIILPVGISLDGHPEPEGLSFNGAH